jgi:hypothetical protein
MSPSRSLINLASYHLAKYFIKMQYAFNKATLEAGKITLQRKDTICAT